MDDTKDVKVKDKELFKIKLALSSLTNSVVICPVVATLYTLSTSDNETWNCCKRGAPGLILTHNSDREIICCQLCIADPESGFALWRENLMISSDYKASQKNFHTFNLISDGVNNKMAGIRFPSDESACTFLRDVLESIPKEGVCPDSPTTKKERSKVTKKIKKSEISQPCMFKHVTSINNMKQKDKVMSRSQSTKSKISKYSGSGSSLDSPDTDPQHNVVVRRTNSLFKR
jgi:WH1 domain.